MVSARPLFGPAGAGALAGIVAAQTRGRERFGRMVASSTRSAPARPPAMAGPACRKRIRRARRSVIRKAREAKAKAEAQAVGT